MILAENDGNEASLTLLFNIRSQNQGHGLNNFSVTQNKPVSKVNLQPTLPKLVNQRLGAGENLTEAGGDDKFKEQDSTPAKQKQELDQTNFEKMRLY